MNFNIVKSPPAERDIEEAFVYLALEDLEVGERFISAVEKSLERLSEFPFVGTVKEYKNQKLQNLRMWRMAEFEKYLVFYLVSENTVDIIRVLHSSRDIAGELE